MKPEITAPGGSIYSVNGKVPGGQAYENMSGTSMAAPQVTGMAALVAQYIRETGLAEKTGHTARQLAQSLLMSTAEPLLEDYGEDGDGYCPCCSRAPALPTWPMPSCRRTATSLMGEDATAVAGPTAR